MDGKRCWKIQEFVGHSCAVTCAALGHKSGRVMATGGQDGKVNMWQVGSPNCILSLSPLTSPVVSASFNGNEELVCAGAQSGALRIWDLAAAKVVRHLTGHKAAVRATVFHPYGEFIASGSDDHKIRMWDFRRKACIFTYKGHEDSVASVEFSPDGRWIGSVSQDRSCKLWDITAGKLLHELKDHTGPLTCLNFHPRELLLATASADRTCKVYDVEQFRTISSTSPESNSIQKVLFNDSESSDCLFTASQDYCKVYAWDNDCQHLDTISVKWGRPSDIMISTDQLIGCSFSQNIVSVYKVDLKTVNFSVDKSKSANPSAAKPQPTFVPSSKRANNVTVRPHTSCGVPASDNTLRSAQPKEAPCSNSNSETRFREVSDNEENVFKPQSTLARSPTKESAENPPETNSQPTQKAKAAPMNDAKLNNHEIKPGAAADAASVNKKEADEKKTTDKTEVVAPGSEVKKPVASVSKTVTSSTAATKPVKQHLPPRKNREASEPLGGALSWYERNQVPTRDQNIPEKPGACEPNVTAEPTKAGQSGYTPPNQPSASPAGPSQQRDLLDLDVSAFLPPKRNDTPSSSAVIDDREAVGLIRKGLESMRVVLTNRHKNLEIVRALWTSGDVMTSINAAVKMDDQALVVDILNILILKPSLWSLDLCLKMLPEIKSLMSSKYETYTSVGCSSLKLVLKNFAQVIRSNLKTPPSTVDISREERHKKCRGCYEHLSEIKRVLDSKQQTSGKLSSQFRELKILIDTLE